MDFTKPEAAQDLSGLVGTIAEAVCTPQHQRELDGREQRFDTTLWGKLIDADILSTAAPPSVSGEALPAVTLPYWRSNTGLSAESCS
jgi:hypothetical protein